MDSQTSKQQCPSHPPGQPRQVLHLSPRNTRMLRDNTAIERQHLYGMGLQDTSGAKTGVSKEVRISTLPLGLGGTCAVTRSSAVPERKLRQKGDQPLATGLRLANVCQGGLRGMTGSDETAQLRQRSV